MSFDRFINKDVVGGFTPVFGKTIDDSNIIKKEQPLTDGDVTGKFDVNLGLEFTPNKEIHIYADGNLIKSSYGNYIDNEKKNSLPIVYTTPELDLRKNGIEQGVYSILYNFHHNIISNLKILSISSDRTEVKLTYTGGGVTNGFLPTLREAFQDFGINSFDTSGVKKDFVLNFKENNIYDILNMRFEGPRTGLVNTALPYPSEQTISNNGVKTLWYVPFDTALEAIGIWRTMIQIEENGDLTGNFKRYRLIRTTDGLLEWQGGNLLNRVPTDLDTAEPLLQDALDNGDTVTVGTNPTNKVLRYDRFDNNFTSIESVIIKLNRPLDEGIAENNLCDVDARIMKSWVEKIIAFPSIENQDRPDFSSPNYSLDLYDDRGADGTNWKTWDSLLDVNATTSQQLINKYFSGSFGSVKLNIDYSDFSNFIHFSSATERVDNFKYKLQQIESYNNRINLLETISGSEAITNISQSIVRRDNIIGGFDDFEHYLYYSNSTNNYTHWSSSAYLIEPYPKVSTFPHILYDVTSSQGDAWYNGVYSSASLYDEFNDSRLRNMIPIHLQADARNEEYVTFVDMIGQHFDIQWTYIKSLTDINRREEHPKDGMADDLLKSVAESLGWKLSNGYQSADLWKYALGVEEDGTLYQTGLLESKSREQITHEIWRRIVNTIPMLYKTKGTTRSIKAILSTYGIPQAFLKIREFGGPTIQTRKNIFEHERFVYKLQASPSKYISNPWDTIESDRPNSIEVIGKLPQDDYHILNLSTPSGDIDCFWDYDSTTSTARIRATWGSQTISSDYVPYKSRREVVFTLNSSSADIRAAWVDDWGEILANPTASLTTPNSDFVNAWNGNGTVRVPGNTTISTASIQEVRYFRDGISNEIVTEHAKNREAYFSDDNTTDLDIDTSFDKLMYRIFPDSGFTNNTSSISSIHPNQRFTSSDSGLVLSASLVNMKPLDLVGEVDTQFSTIPSVGALNLMNNKIRIESASLRGKLNPDKSNELSEYDYAPLDSNLLGTYFAVTDTINFDIINSEGYFEADDWVGDPDKRYNDDYPRLKWRAKNYFQKYTSGTSIDLIMDMLSRYDMAVFDQIKQLLPARVDWHKGILIEPHILERNKYRRNRDISISRHMYDGTIDIGSDIITASRHDLDVSTIRLYDFSPSTYQYQIATLDGDTYVNRTNGYWEYSPTGSVVLNARPSTSHQKIDYFYSTDESASLNLPNSSSYSYAEVQDTRLPLSLENLYYNGCRISSDSLTTNSEDTPDGGPVVEITEVDSNVLVFSGQLTSNDVVSTDTNTKPALRQIPTNVLLSTQKANLKSKRVEPSNASEVKTLKPLPFVVRNTKPKTNIRPNRTQSLLKSLLNRFR